MVIQSELSRNEIVKSQMVYLNDRKILWLYIENMDNNRMLGYFPNDWPRTRF